ncbi:hypothetical protein ACFVHB_29910 [Kitasatospora sp. NPDC127111]|uniref:hypothetical protein n=1 Tax=Kitasatospora sp. NPDC127111 TaxID=3345363 RepID=UPI00364067FE
MGEKFKATDAGFAEFAKRFNAFIDAATENQDISHLGVMAKNGGKPKLGPPYNGILPGGGDSFEMGLLLQQDFTAFCTGVSTSITTMQTRVVTMRERLRAAHDILQNGEDEALTTAQFTTLLSTALGGGTGGTGGSGGAGGKP